MSSVVAIETNLFVFAKSVKLDMWVEGFKRFFSMAFSNQQYTF